MSVILIASVLTPFIKMPNDLILSVAVGLSALVQSVFALSFAASAGVAAVILISPEPGSVAAAAILMSVIRIVL